MGFFSEVGAAVGGIAGGIIDAGAEIVDEKMPDAGDLVEDFADKAGLPEWVGDLGSGIANYATGNYLAATADLVDFANSDFGETEVIFMKNDEPSDLDGDGLQDTDWSYGATPEGNRLPGDDRLEGGSEPQPAATPPAPPSSPPPPTKPTQSGPAPTNTAAVPTDLAANAAKANDEAKAAKEAVMGWVNTMSPEALQAAMRNGTIPPEVLNNPEALRLLQMKIEDMAKMNQLLTNMMQAMHQMSMAVVNNVRA